MRLVDGHAHLGEIPEVDLEIGKAREAGVVAIVAVGMETESNRRALELSESHKDFVFPALGLHPWSLKEDFSHDLEFIEKNMDKCVAVGEVGMDFKYDKDRNLQVPALEAILGIAERHRKPVIMHTRWAWKEAFGMVEERGMKDVVFHWYSGPAEILKGILELGCLVSASLAVEYSEHHRQAIKEVPLDRLLLETDTPVRYRDHVSRPVDVLRTLRAVSELKNIPEEEVAEVTTRNAIGLFGLPL